VIVNFFDYRTLGFTLSLQLEDPPLLGGRFAVAAAAAAAEIPKQDPRRSLSRGVYRAFHAAQTSVLGARIS